METQVKKHHFNTVGGYFLGIKFTRGRDSGHLSSAPKRFICHHKGLGGNNCLGLTFNWDYINKTVDISMPKYVKAALQKLQH